MPTLWLIEIKNVLLVNERRGRITAQGSEEFLEILRQLDIRIDPETPALNDPSLLLLARLHRLTAYDAAYLELAKRKQLPLATFDKDLLKAVSVERITIFGQA